MKVPHNAHVAVVDGNRFVVMRNTGQMFEPKLSNPQTPSLEPTNHSAGIRNQDDAGRRTGSTDLDELAHAAAAADWLNAEAKAGRIDDLIIIADPKTLGEMRRHYHGELQSRLRGEVPKTMTNEPAERIAQVLAAS
ncbi:attachment protein [Erythrobacteraceae bacterium CFH 75059]|uniref:baeRF12 domain-containing protein n=1 Tax=Qipengyuania thermophila TaxID=2509361 RepID=UPI0010211098|nr:host attachment protein [Qipengyuania thermophila]TCD04302.1 attachment protein [Erythrobacteraceae bacterium CFH 75059]